MNEVTAQVMPNIEIHQCLFGYQDGHRLLASSLRLPEEATSTLLLLSDLASGISMTENQSYWTGVPLSSTKSYALMRTWLAPEMSRPGCVWTHILIISFSDIARFPDLSILMEYTSRPIANSDFEKYSLPISLPPSPIKRSVDSFDSADALQIIQSIYSEQNTGKILSPLGIFDNAIFAVWSQQWPQLRRSFSFRTATSSNANISSTIPFNLVIVLEGRQNKSNHINSGIDSIKIKAWEHICINDLVVPHSTDLRRFLWRYGSDVQLGCKRFKLLTTLYLQTRCINLGQEVFYKILKNIIKEFPSPEDGKVLKEDVIGHNKYSLLPLADPIDLLAFYLNNSIASKLPALSSSIFEAIYHSWPNRSEEILSIAEVAAKGSTKLGTKFLELLVPLVNASTFFSSTLNRSNLQDKLLTSNPFLLDSDDLINVPHTELLQYINYIPNNAYTLINKILYRLLEINDSYLAEAMLHRFPNSTVEVVMERIESYFNGNETSIPKIWVKAISKHPSLILNGGFIERSQTTSALSFIASMLGYTQPIILQAGPLLWANGLENVSDDIKGTDRQNFLIFILEVALHKPISGCEPLFEMAFSTVYKDLKYSNLNREKVLHLREYLPDLGLLLNWDQCRRLKVGIVDAYVKHKLSFQSFKQLTANSILHKELVELAQDSKAGRKFLKEST